MEEMNDGAYYVSNGVYDCMFITTANGVVVIDAPQLLEKNR
ncbi:hypothetical protein [Flavobacterium sp. LAR06]